MMEKPKRAEKAMEDNLPLHLSHVQKSATIINRSHALLHSIALIALIYYRASFVFQNAKPRDTHILLWLLVFASELLLSFMWFLNQAFRWRPVSRTVFPERLPADKELPAIDVFLCTADASKEPTVGVMNTVISAMALDYPPDKLFVYLSDDGGCSVTLHAMQEAWRFAKWWLPFCRKFGIKTRCPEAYFLAADDDILENSWSSELKLERKKVQVINEKCIDEVGAEKAEMPMLLYVSREKRPSHPHHFKAGALNVLLRVSALINNSPCILALDCDMYCNDPTSARQAMCFHLDPKVSPSLAFVQFPQKFHNISKKDIYDSRMRAGFTTLWQGMDGLAGPMLSGTGFYIKRKALYGDPIKEGFDVMDLKQSFGHSNEFIKSLREHCKPNPRDFSSEIFLNDTQFLASCAYENQTKWGKKVGFLYFSVVEDVFTSFINLHGKGWTSVFCDPARPAFLGAGTTNLNDVLVQGTRWSSGLVEVGISRFCPLIYGTRMSALQNMCYALVTLLPFRGLPLFCLATIPQLCLLHGITLYPEVSNWFFIVFLFIFLSSHSKHLQEVLSSGYLIVSWRNEQRMWYIRSVTCDLYGCLDAIMKRIGIREACFLPTNKVVDDDQLKLYQMGKFDFQAPAALLAPVVTLVILNLISFIGGFTRAVAAGGFSEMFIQISLSFFIVTMSYPVIEGMVLRKDKGRVPPSVSILSAVISMVFLSLGSLILM